MLVVHVFVHVKPEYLDDFIRATIENARCSRQEPGIARFDVLQENANPCKFVLIEIYRTPDDPARHKETVHYARWRDAVEKMMVEPRASVKYHNLYPDDAGIEATRWGLS